MASPALTWVSLRLMYRYVGGEGAAPTKPLNALREWGGGLSEAVPLLASDDWALRVGDCRVVVLGGIGAIGMLGAQCHFLRIRVHFALLGNEGLDEKWDAQIKKRFGVNAAL